MKKARKLVCFAALILLLSSQQLVSQTSQPRNAAASSAHATTGQGNVKCTNNGTYVNKQGQTVERPETCSGPPTGATAQCRDGSYSFSRSRSGTCSHHGGVSKWL